MRGNKRKTSRGFTGLVEINCARGTSLTQASVKLFPFRRLAKTIHEPTRSFTKEMKAVIFNQHGGPEVLEYAEAPDPTIKANEVLVEVKACALNHLDIWARGGLPGIAIPLPHILGNDIAGVVREVGELVSWVQDGRRSDASARRVLRPLL